VRSLRIAAQILGLILLAGLWVAGSLAIWFVTHIFHFMGAPSPIGISPLWIALTVLSYLGFAARLIQLERAKKR
jgi:hypothetical protein